jgi:putative endonuclease
MTERESRGRAAYYAGEAAELQVARAYEQRGYAIVRHRWRGPSGEVDLITRNDEGLVFVEVKQSRTLACAAERLSRQQMERIYDNAAHYLDRESQGQLTNVRFDVALVDGTGSLEIIENAFGMG